jgi:hypothetical protein
VHTSAQLNTGDATDNHSDEDEGEEGESDDEEEPPSLVPLTKDTRVVVAPGKKASMKKVNIKLLAEDGPAGLLKAWTLPQCATLRKTHQMYSRGLAGVAFPWKTLRRYE